MLLDLKKDFSRFLGMAPDRLHFAAHSHHYWPDVTFEAQQQAWMDAALLADKKWGKIFGEVMPAVRQGIAKRLHLPNPETICFAVNTHEFVMRIFSCFPSEKKIKILTTDAEFYSFRRQVQRYAEENLVDVTIVPAEPFDTFSERFKTALNKEYDLVYFSQVFFNSGYVVTDFSKIVSGITSQETIVVIDGYHGFMAVPTDLSSVHERVFYMGGGYKYAMSGEGACFMHCPDRYGPRPRNTGWFAEMDSLATQKTGKVDYEQSGARFFGATMEPVGLYRMRAVFDWLEGRHISVEDIRAHVVRLQEKFLENTTLKGLMINETHKRGNFLTFKINDAATLQKKLFDHHIITDNRGDRLRFGFGIYHDDADIDRLIGRMKDMK